MGSGRRAGERGVPAAAEIADTTARDAALAERERALVASCLAILAAAYRQLLFAHYTVLGNVRALLQEYERVRSVAERARLVERLAAALGWKSRSTLQRMMLLSLLSLGEFEEILARSDAWGFPLAIWEFVKVAGRRFGRSASAEELLAGHASPGRAAPRRSPSRKRPAGPREPLQLELGAVGLAAWLAMPQSPAHPGQLRLAFDGGGSSAPEPGAPAAPSAPPAAHDAVSRAPGAPRAASARRFASRLQGAIVRFLHTAADLVGTPSLVMHHLRLSAGLATARARSP